MSSTPTKTRYRPLAAFTYKPAPMPSRNVGPQAVLTQIPLDCLVVDESYQRSITQQGRGNIVRIVECFDWRMFSPLIVVPVEGGRWAIIDGQHRATAALMHGGISTVPCMVIDATPAQAAACFAAINGAVTAMNKGQMWHARVASGEHFACQLAAVCQRTGVTILKAKASDVSWRVGDTLAVGAIETTAKRLGLDVLEVTLAAVTGSRGGNAGLLRADVIKAVLANVAAQKAGRAHALAALETVSLAEELDRAAVAALADRAPVHTHLTSRLAEAFAATSAPAPPAKTKARQAVTA
jgi:hypothetical protein